MFTPGVIQYYRGPFTHKISVNGLTARATHNNADEVTRLTIKTKLWSIYFIDTLLLFSHETDEFIVKSIPAEVYAGLQKLANSVAISAQTHDTSYIYDLYGTMMQVYFAAETAEGFMQQFTKFMDTFAEYPLEYTTHIYSMTINVHWDIHCSISFVSITSPVFGLHLHADGRVKLHAEAGVSKIIVDQNAFKLALHRFGIFLIEKIEDNDELGLAKFHSDITGVYLTNDGAKISYFIEFVMTFL